MFSETWNYDCPTIKSSLTVKVEGTTNVSCVVDGLFIPKKTVSVTVNVDNQKSGYRIFLKFSYHFLQYLHKF